MSLKLIEPIIVMITAVVMTRCTWRQVGLFVSVKNDTHASDVIMIEN